jgi:hypothetical protein
MDSKLPPEIIVPVTRAWDEIKSAIDLLPARKPKRPNLLTARRRDQWFKVKSRGPTRMSFKRFWRVSRQGARIPDVKDAPRAIRRAAALKAWREFSASQSNT